jgi:alanyl-tRNA synthetase
VEAAELRRRFLTYFEQNGHTLVPSASLIPHDPDLLFTIAGMVPFKPYFVGDETAPYSRAASIQKCFRAPDIDQIGTTKRHLTFFEMMGNFSFGDYFKQEAIEFAWGLITEGFGFDPEQLWVTVHVSDNDASDIWRSVAGIRPERIQRLDEDNFWAMGEVGPCGPCSEIYFDKGPAYGADGGPAHGDGDRFVEFWNLVFMQYNRGGDGSLLDLPTKNIDTGSGFERVLSIRNNEDSVFATDLFVPLMETAQSIVGKHYGKDESTDIAIRRIAEHGRAMTMLVSDGVLPSNEGRGYVLRRIIRRAILAARREGSDRAVTESLVAATIEKMADAYPSLITDQSLISSILQREEDGFARTLRAGLSLLTDEADNVVASKSKVFPGNVAFKLHDTHGFPLELTAEVVEERGLAVDRSAFDLAMGEQRARARAASKGKTVGDDSVYREILDASGVTTFMGRDAARYSIESTILGLMATQDDSVEVFLDATPFYAESGGQVGDTGTIVTETGRLEVSDTQSVLGGLVSHKGRLTGEILPGQVAVATIDGLRRDAVRRNHTATHLLHAALRTVLGDHVRQQGSLVEADRLRFDFAHTSGLAAEEIDAILSMVNEDVVVNQSVDTIEASRQEAEAMGAVAFFGDKYGDRVRVVRAGDHSLEFCGGTHVRRLGDIGQIQVVSEASIGSNTRRLEAVTGLGAMRRSREMELVLASIASTLKTSQDDVVPSMERLIEKQRETEKALFGLRQSSLATLSATLVEKAVNDTLASRVDGVSVDELRTMAQELRQRGVRSILLIGDAGDGKVAMAVATDGAVDAKTVVKELGSLVGGGGGGSTVLATAGGKNLDGIEAALAKANELFGG